MNKMQELVQDFHIKYCHFIGMQPSLLPNDLLKFRINLCKEELDELIQSFDKNDFIGIVDGIGDLLYVIFGLCVCLGIDIEPIFEEIHRSNMTKDISNERISKPIKGKNFSLPNIKEELNKQGYLNNEKI